MCLAQGHKDIPIGAILTGSTIFACILALLKSVSKLCSR